MKQKIIDFAYYLSIEKNLSRKTIAIGLDIKL